ncbi:MAG: hypothetical protein QOD71_1334 [Thermoleophilaceae bacterium]|jgi:hypothetical protein|nr:hypothetical protein [Thermoleophilaceae bacterium]
MRKLLIPALAISVALAVAGIAYAANIYTVSGSTKPGGKGTPAKPLPVSLNFSYTVKDENPANRGTPVEKYFIGAEGLVTYPEAFPSCSGASDGANNEDLAKVKKACKKARVGGGIIKAYAGPPTDQTTKLNCVLELNLYNLKPGKYNTNGGPVKITKKQGGLAIRIDGVQAGIPDLSDKYKGKCAAAQNESILAPYVQTKIKGVTSDELQFTVPQSLLHVGPLETAVQEVTSQIAKRTAKKKIGGVQRTVGFYSSIGCKGGKRSIQVTFISEAGQKTPKSRDGKC